MFSKYYHSLCSNKIYTGILWFFLKAWNRSLEEAQKSSVLFNYNMQKCYYGNIEKIVPILALRKHKSIWQHLHCTLNTTKNTHEVAQMTTDIVGTIKSEWLWLFMSDKVIEVAYSSVLIENNSFSLGSVCFFLLLLFPKWRWKS